MNYDNIKIRMIECTVCHPKNIHTSNNLGDNLTDHLVYSSQVHFP